MVVHGDKLRWLLWLRWKLLLRNFTRGSGRARTIIGTIFLTLIIVSGGLMLAGATFAGYRFAPAPFNTEILFLVLTGIYLLWIITPLTQIAMNEGLDVSKLALFPLTRAELMISLLLSTLLDTTTIFIVLLLTAVVAGWAFSIPLALMALLTVLVFYVQVIGMSQLVFALLSRMMQGRRLRDLGIIIAVLLSLSGYLCQFAFRGAGVVTAMQHQLFSTYLQWLPPGIAARAIQQAYVGNWGMSFLWLAILLVVSVLVLYLWQVLVARSLVAPDTGGSLRVRRQQAKATPVAADAINIVAPSADIAQTPKRHLIPPQILAITIKDIKYYRRDPMYARMIILPLVYVAVLTFSTILGTNNAVGPNAAHEATTLLGALRLLEAPALVLLSLFTLAYNSLGFEGQNLSTLFLFPINPRHILWGKNLVLVVLGLIEIIIIVLVVAFVDHVWDFIAPSLTLGLAGLGIVLASGNITSVFLPQRMRMSQRGFQSSSTMSTQAGCLRAVMSLAAMVVTLIVLLPVLAGLVLPIIFHMTWLWAATMPFSLVYGWGIYFIITSLVASRLLNREPEIIAAVVKE